MRANVSLDRRLTRRADPAPFLGRDALLLGADGTDGILQRFERFGFYPRGRFGGWRYGASSPLRTWIR